MPSSQTDGLRSPTMKRASDNRGTHVCSASSQTWPTFNESGGIPPAPVWERTRRWDLPTPYPTEILLLLTHGRHRLPRRVALQQLACDRRLELVLSHDLLCSNEGQMKRREFIALVGGAAAWPLTARAQHSGKTFQIGMLLTANPRSTSFIQAFEQKLRELGYIEGRSIVIEYRYAEGHVDRLPSLAAELARLDVDVILTTTELSTRAATGATTKIPILMVAINYDPIALGFVDSIARPGANVTGIFFQHLDLLAKRFGLFKEMLPSIGRVAIFSDAQTTDQLQQVEAANRSVGLELQPLNLQDPPYDFENAFRVAKQARAEAIFVLESAPIFRGRAQIVQLAMENRLPTSFAFREYVQAGGLVSYGVSFSTMFVRAAEYADKILKGAKPTDLPVELASKFELVINLKTAKALGLIMAPEFLARADDVIE
jgi:putative tryptophan/tyrosine transport system substrate-binding protein